MKKEKSTKKESNFMIENKKNDDQIRWKKINCVCSQDPKDVINQYPLRPCLRCKCQASEDDFMRAINYGKEYTVPKWKMKDGGSGVKIGTLTVNHVKIIRDKKTDEIIAFVQYPL